MTERRNPGIPGTDLIRALRKLRLVPEHTTEVVIEANTKSFVKITTVGSLGFSDLDDVVQELKEQKPYDEVGQ